MKINLILVIWPDKIFPAIQCSVLISQIALCTVRVWRRAGSIGLGHVVAGVITKAIIASRLGLVVITDVAPLPPCAVSRPTVALDSVIIIQVSSAITLAVTVVRGHRGRSSVS